jgi:hypothetical protein
MTSMGDSFAFFGFLSVIGVVLEIYQLKSAVRKLEAQLDSIRERLGIIEPLRVSAEVAGLLQAGRKIEAIKVYRQATGAGLAEAKAAVERIAAGAPAAPSKIIQP